MTLLGKNGHYYWGVDVGPARQACYEAGNVTLATSGTVMLLLQFSRDPKTLDSIVNSWFLVASDLDDVRGSMVACWCHSNLTTGMTSRLTEL